MWGEHSCSPLGWEKPLRITRTLTQDTQIPQDPTAVPPPQDSVRHIEFLIPILTFAVAAILATRGSTPTALGFLFGAAVAYANFRWLKNTVTALVNAITQRGPQASRPAVVFRFLIRFVLIALAAYVIFTSYPKGFHGFLGGLFVPVLAIFVETAYVVSVAIRGGAKPRQDV